MDLDLVTQRLLAMSHTDKKVYSSRSQSHSNLYEHLSKLVPQLSAFEQEKISSIANLENISEYIKKYDFKPTQPLTEEQVNETLTSVAIFCQDESRLPSVAVTAGKDKGDPPSLSQRDHHPKFQPACRKIVCPRQHRLWKRRKQSHLLCPQEDGSWKKSWTSTFLGEDPGQKQRLPCGRGLHQREQCWWADDAWHWKNERRGKLQYLLGHPEHSYPCHLLSIRIMVRTPLGHPGTDESLKNNQTSLFGWTQPSGRFQSPLPRPGETSAQGPNRKNNS